MPQHHHIAERCEHAETKRHLCDHRLPWNKWRVRTVPCEPSFCPNALPRPQEFRPPERLAVVPEALVALAVNNITALVDYDTAKGDEVVRRVLATLRLADPKMPSTPVDHYPDGSPADPPIGASSGARCQWGKLRRGGDVVMCALDEDWADDGTPGPGHDTPREHAFRVGSDHIPFTEDDPRAFHAHAWMGDSPETVRWMNDLMNDPHP